MFRKDRSPVKKHAKIPPKVKTPPKLPYEMTNEELEESVHADVKAQLAPKKPPTDPIKELLNTITKKILDRTVENLYNPPPSLLTDYECCIEKTHISQMEEKKCGKKVPQLGEQEVQSIAPLKVFSDKADLYNDNVAHEVIGDTGYAIAQIAYQFVLGQPLVTDTGALTTQLWRLHNWYMTEANEGRFYFMAGAKKQHYFREYALQIEYSELS